MTGDPVTDNTVEAAAAAIEGDAGAIQSIWQDNRHWIAAVLLAHKPRHEDLEDLLQEVAMTLVSKISTLRDATSVRAWMRTVAVNVARASLRTSVTRPRPTTDGALLSEQAGRHDGSPDKCELLRAVLEMVRGLPTAYREPLMLRAVQGLRSKQIAEILAVPPATVDTRIARARRMLLEQTRQMSGFDMAWRDDDMSTSLARGTA